MKILLVSDYFSPFIGGAEISSQTIFSQLARRGAKVSVLTHRLPNTVAHETLDGLEVHRERFFFGDTVNILERFVFYLRAFAIIVGWLRKEKPDIVFAQQLVSIPTVFASKIFRIPTVVMIRDYWPVCYYRNLLKPDFSICATHEKCFTDILSCSRNSFGYHLEKSKFTSAVLTIVYPFLIATHTRLAERIMKSANIVVVSNYVKNTLERNGFKTRKISVVYNPVSVASQSTEDCQSPFSLVFVGALEFAKGLQNVIKVLPQVCGEVKEAKLHIVGGGPQTAYFKALAVDLGVGERCEFHGRISEEEKMELYESCKAVIVPSIWPEPFGRVVAEAITLGKPVIAFGVGGITELVDEDVGVLVPRCDLNALRDAVLMVLTDKKSFDFESARERFSPEKTAQQYMAVIKKVYDGK